MMMVSAILSSFGLLASRSNAASLIDWRRLREDDTVTPPMANRGVGGAYRGGFWKTPMPDAGSAPDSKNSRALARTDVAGQLERILAHPLFHRSQRLSAFLRFAVERTLAGEADSLKEVVIGAEALQRGGAFDPQTDNI